MERPLGQLLARASTLIVRGNSMIKSPKWLLHLLHFDVGRKDMNCTSNIRLIPRNSPPILGGVGGWVRKGGALMLRFFFLMEKTNVLR